MDAGYDNDGTATVSIDERNTPNDASDDARVTLNTDGGDEYSCPADIDEKFEAGDIRAGRDKLTLQRVRERVDAIEKAHPGNTLPPAVYDEYQRLGKRDDALVDAFNKTVERHNAILEANCTSA